MKFTDVVSLAITLGSASAANYKGFNYGNMDPQGQPYTKDHFSEQFAMAKNLEGADNFNSARLYTMIQGGTQNDVISAIPAAIEQDTSLLLGLWASGGKQSFDNEIAALKKTVEQFGDKLKGKVAGISVGSEDLYRNSIMGAQNNAGIGEDVHVLIKYIKEVKDILNSSPLKDVPIGHVDTWTAWVNDTNADVFQEIDWLGFDAYPYFQKEEKNSIDDAYKVFHDAYDKTKAVAEKNGKQVWITETGWPISGKKSGLAEANKENAQRFWREIGCEMFGSTNVWWYILQEGQTGVPDFSVADEHGKPYFDLSCKNVKKHQRVKNDTSSSSSSSGAESSKVATSTAVSNSTASASKAESGSGSKATSGVESAASASASASSDAGSGTGSGSGSSSGSVSSSSAKSDASSNGDAAQETGGQKSGGADQTSGASSMVANFGFAGAAVVALLM